MSRIVPAIETAIDPAHPSRLEKKTNIASAAARSVPHLPPEEPKEIGADPGRQRHGDRRPPHRCAVSGRRIPTSRGDVALRGPVVAIAPIPYRTPPSSTPLMSM